ncbi:hypothetical protein RN001_015472 [Aquatica leii]|uniref:Uncharacterized protein n=1 Tax=Aquatica leii TaxID=1421715 RepID=A0AAN7P1V2_9COLE|nr:hypothetical protein RN001_015472 [Aquatica leii]
MNVSFAEEENIIVVPPSDFTPDPRGIGCVLFDSMLKYQNNVAQIDGLNGKEDTYRSLLQRSVRVALALKKRGIQYGDVICVFTYHHLDSCTPLLAALFLGAIIVGIDEDSKTSESAYVFSTVRPKIIFTIHESAKKIENALKKTLQTAEIVVFDKNDMHTPFSEFLKPDVDEEYFFPVPAKVLTDTAIIFFTSGSTGLPKPICHNHDSILYQNNNVLNANYDWTVSLEYTSPFWTVFESVFIITTMLGNTRLIYNGFAKTKIWDFAKHKTSVLVLSTTELLIACKIGRPKDLSLKHLKYVMAGGNVLSKEQIIAAKSLFSEAKFVFTYGQSEVPGLLTMFNPMFKNDQKLMQEKINSVGLGCPGISYKIASLDDETILGPNDIGELRIKTVFSLGLLYNTDSSDLFDNDGWLKTGDMAYYDEDKCFYIVGRAKEMFKYQCFRIIPSIIEKVLLLHTAVDDAVVIGVPHEIDGEHPMGLVLLKDEFKNISAKQIEKFVKRRVHFSHRLRAGVKILDAFVRTSTNKVNKKVMRDLILEGKL